MPKINAYKIPAAGHAREVLRAKGQFWTPDWVAEAMVAYVLANNADTLFDPAVGAGAFFRAAKTIARENAFDIALAGMDIDPMALAQAREFGLTTGDLAQVRIGDFIFQPPETTLSAIVANPPYIRHHRIPAETKVRLKQFGLKTLGKTLDGRAGLHVYFLIRALTLLRENGRLAFILPADTCEGKFANDLWGWITKNFALDAVITFASEASPFPNVDTNPLIFFIRNAKPQKKFLWAKCLAAQTETLKQWVDTGMRRRSGAALTVIRRDLAEGQNTGFSRPPTQKTASRYVLGDFVQVVRGVATGANDFFFLTAEQTKRVGIPANYFVRAVGRTRDVPAEEITQATLDALEAKGRPTFLLALDGESFDRYPENLRKYLREGETRGLAKRPLISQRKPWYKTETRIPPPFLFAYLGRRNARFIRNTANIVPLTGFLCVYPKNTDAESLTRLWKILSHPDIVANLAMVGKSYGDGAVKVEPRALEKLPIPENAIAQLGAPRQLRLFESQTVYSTSRKYAKRKR